MTDAERLDDGLEVPDPRASLEVLVENHRAFLRFLERRVASKDTAALPGTMEGTTCRN